MSLGWRGCRGFFVTAVNNVAVDFLDADVTGSGHRGRGCCGRGRREIIRSGFDRSEEGAKGKVKRANQKAEAKGRRKKPEQ